MDFAGFRRKYWQVWSFEVWKKMLRQWSLVAVACFRHWLCYLSVERPCSCRCQPQISWKSLLNFSLMPQMWTDLSVRLLSYYRYQSTVHLAWSYSTTVAHSAYDCISDYYFALPSSIAWHTAMSWAMHHSRYRTYFKILLLFKPPILLFIYLFNLISLTYLI